MDDINIREINWKVYYHKFGSNASLAVAYVYCTL